MVLNGKLYTGITFHVFQNFIRGWLGSLYYCYILQSRSVSDGFETFNTSNDREIVHESNGTDELDNCNTTSSVERIHTIEDESLGSPSEFDNLMKEF